MERGWNEEGEVVGGSGRNSVRNGGGGGGGEGRIHESKEKDDLPMSEFLPK